MQSKYKLVAECANDKSFDYYIKNTETNEVRVLQDCILFDIELIDDDDFEEFAAVK